MLKTLQVRLQQYVNHELRDVQARFRKGRGNRYKIANIRGSKKKQESSKKSSTSALLTTPKPLTIWITTNCGKFLKEKGIKKRETEGNTRPPYLPPEKSVCRSRGNN